LGFSLVVDFVLLQMYLHTNELECQQMSSFIKNLLGLHLASVEQTEDALALTKTGSHYRDWAKSNANSLFGRLRVIEITKVYGR
jgi:hypothetical protein